MSFTFLQVGQAGNQIGSELWRLFRKEIPEFSDSVFDSLNNEKARGVLVDTEPKVVREYLTDSELKEFFLKENVFSSEEGRGNNWAYGYRSVEEDFEEGVMEAVRREAENGDFYEGVVMMHSIAGGTGSGLGSRLMEEFKEQYGKAKLVNVVVWPHPSGETPLQNYNSGFTTSFLQKYSDAVIVFQNEEMMKLIPKGIDGKKIHSVSMKNLNEYISVGLKNVLVPCSDDKISLYDIIELVPAPQLKLLSGNTNPFLFSGKLSCDKFKDWQDVISTCLSQISTKKSSPYLISSRAIGKYKDTGAFDDLPEYVSKKVASKFKGVDWNDQAVTPVCINDPPFLSEKDCSFSFTLLSNSQTTIQPLKNILSYGKAKFKSKAYLHWYSKYDVGEEEFKEAFKAVEDTVDFYEKSIQ